MRYFLNDQLQQMCGVETGMYGLVLPDHIMQIFLPVVWGHLQV
jgi:hypothetical protein